MCIRDRPRGGQPGQFTLGPVPEEGPRRLSASHQGWEWDWKWQLTIKLAKIKLVNKLVQCTLVEKQWSTGLHSLRWFPLGYSVTNSKNSKLEQSLHVLKTTEWVEFVSLQNVLCILKLYLLFIVYLLFLVHLSIYTVKWKIVKTRFFWFSTVYLIFVTTNKVNLTLYYIIH